MDTAGALSGWTWRNLMRLAPGLVLAAAIAVAAVALDAGMRAGFGARSTLPPVVIALIIGMILHPLSRREELEPGLSFAVRSVLRVSIALLGLRVSLGEIAGLGLATALLVVLAMAITIMTGLLLARFLGREDGLGALAGVATAVCGASAALATASVIPDYKGKSEDVAFTVIAMNALSTVAMVAYPPLCVALALTDMQTGILFGAAIHDVTQVAGAAQNLDVAGANAAIIVKLFRVFLLLPVVLIIGAWFARRTASTVKASVPIPLFAIGFLALCVVNSLMPALPALQPAYTPLRDALLTLSGWGLLIAIGALGIKTALSAMVRLGWRHLALVSATSVIILAAVLGGLMLVT